MLLVAFTPQAHSQGGVPLWTNYYNGGIGNDRANALAVDASNNVIVTGNSTGSGGTSDYAAIKYSSAGVPLWTNRYNGPENGNDEAYAVAVDGSNNVFVTGRSAGGGTSYDYATVAYSSAGTPLWTNSYDGPESGYDAATAIAVDSSGDVIVTGSAAGGGGSDYTTIKYSGVGVPLWTNHIDELGFAFERIAAVAVNGDDNVYVTGSRHGDYVTVAYSSDGTLLWTNRYSALTDIAAGIAVDSGGNVIVTGSSGGGAGYDYATIKYSSDGALLWTNRYGEPGLDDFVADIAVDGSGNVFVTGKSDDSGIPPFRYEDYATVAYSSAGAPLWTNRYNGTGSYADFANAIAVDHAGNVFVTGSSYGDNGVLDAVTVAYSNEGVPLWTNRYNRADNYQDHANDIAVDSCGNVFVTGSSGGDFLTIKYSSAVVPPIQLAIEPDGSGGYFIRFNGSPDSTYHLLRASDLTGPWPAIATNTAPASGLVEFHETNPPPGGAFYRTLTA